MSETLTAVGKLDGIMEKSGGWRELHIAIPGKQYPLKISTKKEELVQLAKAAGENVMEWTYTEQDSGNPNPHQPGKNYINRYFEGVAPLSENEQTQVADQVAATHAVDGMTPAKWDAKERRDYRSRAWAQTISAFYHTIKPEEDPADVFLRLQPFQRKVYEDVCQSFAYPEDGSDLPFE